MQSTPTSSESVTLFWRQTTWLAIHQQILTGAWVKRHLNSKIKWSTIISLIMMDSRLLILRTSSCLFSTPQPENSLSTPVIMTSLVRRKLTNSGLPSNFLSLQPAIGKLSFTFQWLQCTNVMTTSSHLTVNLRPRSTTSIIKTWSSHPMF